MSIRVSLTHRTSYEYERPALVSPQVIRLRPAPHNRTPLVGYSMRIFPEEHFLNWQQDPFGNYLARVVIPEKTKRFEVLVDLVADLKSYNPFDFFLEESAERSPFVYTDQEKTNLEPYLRKLPATPVFDKFLAEIDRKEVRTVDFLVYLNRLVFSKVEYVIRLEPGVQTPHETLTLKKGSCRDSAWLLVQAFRHLGVAARFVSGYLIQLKPDEPPVTGPKGPTADFTDLHAWAEVYLPGAGWVGLDATSGLLAAEGHIPLACTPEPGSASPVEGMVEKVETEFGFHMQVDRIIDVPRVTGPYSDDTWAEILRQGDAVDRVLSAQDLRLTMGGEPTFVSANNPDAPEWNTEALGADKLQAADRLTRSLHRLWAPGGLLHHGQGKWYPGEPLPRWAFTVVSRADGAPVWKDPSLFAVPTAEPIGIAATRALTEIDARRFLVVLAEVLGVASSHITSAYEDVWHYLLKERRLPTNVDPLKSELENPLERARLARIWQQGLGAVVGWILPLRYGELGFESSAWAMRDPHCFLVPGDSPMGFRLPLDSLPWQPAAERLVDVAPDPTLTPRVLVHRAQIDRTLSQPLVGGTPVKHQGRSEATSGKGYAPGGGSETSNVPPGDDASGLVRTALCAEVRDGLLKLFLPPIASVEGFLQLAAAIERTCEVTRLKIQLEGYPPPKDSRLRTFQVTPDPGVIEVNVPPTRSWRELTVQTAELYEEARRLDLTAEKFELDGRHVGSGGGNHVVMGALTTLDSPFLRRPDLLRSMIAFWHNHPALSFLFSGQFIGPTSQAPRVDEARLDAVYELEIAFEELSRRRSDPWMVDRALRNILTDATGNTHRSEFCIDKLYSPDSTTGRLGLLEMRAFEMPPHQRMAGAQQLLVRALLAAFSQEKYTESLVKWGTGLHDRFLLPHFVKRDLMDALGYLNERGFALDPAWFEPHYQFRFPYYGSVSLDDVELEVRGALEPWHVLGEESAAGGQARYVDSSLERIQVKVRGLTPGRHLVCCNGVEVPLARTDAVNEAVAGIRYRAWQPPSCLHPMIGVHAPLRLDIYDSWNGRALGGCTYHVVHPGGRANEVRPVNAEAAESRRIARFEALGHSPKTYVPIRAGVSADFPLTLDLRRVTP